MGGKIFIWQLEEKLRNSVSHLETLPELQEVDTSTYRLFSALTEEYKYMLTNIVEYLSQNR